MAEADEFEVKLILTPEACARTQEEEKHGHTSQTEKWDKRNVVISIRQKNEPREKRSIRDRLHYSEFFGQFR